MNILRNRFLNTASFLSGPNDPPGGGAGDDGKKPVTLNEDVGAEDDGDAGGDDQNAGDDGAGDDEGDGDDDTGSDDEDDPDLAELPPEVRAKAKAAIERRVAKETGWRDRQLGKLHARVRTAQEDVQAAGEIVNRQPGATQQDPDKKFTQAEVKQEAARLSAQEAYDRDCNDTFAKGASAYQDKWKSAVDKLPKLGGLDVTDMVDINATDQPHVVLFQLSDPDVYDRVMSLPPARRRTEFVKLALKEAPKPKDERISKRPGEVEAPVRPLTGGRKVAAQTINLHDDKVADDAWYAERNRTRRKKFANVE